MPYRNVFGDLTDYSSSKPHTPGKVIRNSDLDPGAASKKLEEKSTVNKPTSNYSHPYKEYYYFSPKRKE